jgi:acyl carrier protein
VAALRLGAVGLVRLQVPEVPDMPTTLSRLTDVFRSVFDDDTIELTAATCADDIADWDSLMHVTLMVNVERAFAVKFSSAEIALLTDVGELVELIDRQAHAIA